MFTNQVVSIRVGTSSSEFGSSEASGRATSVRNPWSCMAMGPCVLAAWPSWLFRTTPCLTVLICSSENSWPFLYEDDFPATELSFPMNFSRLCWKWECSRVPDKNKCIVLLCFTLFYYVRGKSVYFPANAIVGTQVPKHLMVNPQGTSHYFSVQCH